MNASKEVRIFTDSTSDLSPEKASEYGITVIPASVVVGDKGFLDRETIQIQDIINVLREGKTVPKTGTPGNVLIEERFRQQGEGVQIISIHVGSTFSGIYNHALKAAESILPHPEIIDSGTTSMAMGYLAIEAARMVRSHLPESKIIARINDMKSRAIAMVALPTIKYAELGGRVSHLTSVIGSALHICPILEVNGGRITEFEKPRTWAKAKRRLLEIAQSMAFEEIAVMYAQDDTEADDMIRQLPVPASREILKVQIGAALMSHVGPEGLAFCGIKASP